MRIDLDLATSPLRRSLFWLMRTLFRVRNTWGTRIASREIRICYKPVKRPRHGLLTGLSGWMRSLVTLISIISQLL